MWWTVSFAVLALPAALLLFVLVCRTYVFRQPPAAAQTLGVFHPYCHAGGGGERVLWVAIKALESVATPAQPLRVMIYSGDVEATPQEILERARQRFHVDLSSATVQVEFVWVRSRSLMAAERWPRFTMLGQSIGSMVVAFQGLRACTPHVFLDTTGCAFTYFVAKVLAGLPVATYTHYPTITSDMLNTVYQRRPTYNNDAAIASSWLASTLKLLYYRGFTMLYRTAGRLADVVMANSSWTKAHLDALWGLHAGGASVVFPPCNTENFKELPLGGRKRAIISVGQFRPEKDHAKQLYAFAALKRMDPKAFHDVQLILLGGARDADDLARVESLRNLALSLNIQGSVKFMLNCPFQQLHAELGACMVGIHTMWCEHFGIGVVEMMAAGVATIAHRSGGPQSDIVVPFHGGSTGWLADTAEEYALAMADVLRMQASSLLDITARARLSVARFSDDKFQQAFIAAMLPLLRRGNK